MKSTIYSDRMDNCMKTGFGVHSAATVNYLLPSILAKWTSKPDRAAKFRFVRGVSESSHVPCSPGKMQLPNLPKCT